MRLAAGDVSRRIRAAWGGTKAAPTDVGGYASGSASGVVRPAGSRMRPGFPVTLFSPRFLTALGRRTGFHPRGSRSCQTLSLLVGCVSSLATPPAASLPAPGNNRLRCGFKVYQLPHEAPEGVFVSRECESPLAQSQQTFVSNSSVPPTRGCCLENRDHGCKRVARVPARTLERRSPTRRAPIERLRAGSATGAPSTPANEFRPMA